MTVTCPGCKSDRICAVDQVIVQTMVTKWLRFGDGTIDAVDWGANEIGWNGSHPEDPERPYGCRSCGTSWLTSELIVTETDA